MKPDRAVLPGLIGPVLILVLLTIVAFIARPITPIDETRYVSVAWEMWLKHEYLVLLKNGAPYSDKPPLLFWLFNLGWAVGGVNEIWPRLVSPLFSFGSLLLTLSLGRRLWPGEGGVQCHAAWILSSCLLWMLFSTTVMFDVMLTFFVLLGLRGLLMAADGAMRRGFIWLAAAIGFGILAKGPVALLHVLPAAALAPWWRPGLNWKRWTGGVLLAVLGGAAIALAWAVPAAIQGGEEYRRMIFWGQTAGRVTDSFAHDRPFWWYLPLLPALLFPWLLWPGLWRRFAALPRAGLDGGLRFCLAWLLPVFVCFSLISGKQIHYLVPLLPAFALFAGRLLASGENKGEGSGIWLPALAAAALGLAMIGFAPGGAAYKLGELENLPRWPGVALALIAALAAWSGRQASWRMASLAVLGAALCVLIQCYAADTFWRRYDTQPLAREVRKLQQGGVAVANDGRYHAQYQFFGRLEQPVDELKTRAEIQPWFERHPDGVLIFYGQPQPGETPLFSQPYRDETALLLDAAQARARGLLK
ncbi:MAG: glycosyltransferase family 39 protein [Zoogloeaceae bacterium]|jgi:4-amino-4-deoxy-L-arabinose transferase-like glycosyltransferase|nr:glycosyltransferase family 39 protein [Zoogloeaceae bacterium]